MYSINIKNNLFIHYFDRDKTLFTFKGSDIRGPIVSYI